MSNNLAPLPLTNLIATGLPDYPTTTQRHLVDKTLLAKAQFWAKNLPGTWIWKLAVHKAKEAYGIIEPEPFPEVGDTNGNFVCTYSNPETGEYAFFIKSAEVNHA